MSQGCTEYKEASLVGGFVGFIASHSIANRIDQYKGAGASPLRQRAQDLIPRI